MEKFEIIGERMKHTRSMILRAIEVAREEPSKDRAGSHSADPSAAGSAAAAASARARTGEGFEAAAGSIERKAEPVAPAA